MMRNVRRLPLLAAIAVMALALGGCERGAGGAASAEAQLADSSDGSDWPGYGRTFGQQHYPYVHSVFQQ